MKPGALPGLEATPAAGLPWIHHRLTTLPYARGWD